MNGGVTATVDQSFSTPVLITKNQIAYHSNRTQHVDEAKNNGGGGAVNATMKTKHVYIERTVQMFESSTGKRSGALLSDRGGGGGSASASASGGKYLIEDPNLFVTADARAMLEDAGVILFIKDASTNKSGLNTSSSMEISAAPFLANEEFDLHDMRVPTNLPKDAPKLDKGN